MRLLAIFLLIGGGIAVVQYFKESSKVYRFPGLVGPASPSIIAPEKITPITAYKNGSQNSMAVLVGNPDSAWLSLAHGLKSIGIPFFITRDYKEAFKHKVVLVYPYISGKDFSEDAFRAMAAHPQHGGTLIATQILGGGLGNTFGFTDYDSAEKYTRLRFNSASPYNKDFLDAREKEIPIGRKVDGNARSEVEAYIFNKPQNVVATYDDGRAAIVSKAFPQGGQALGFGFDLGYLLSLGFNNQDNEISRNYVNQFEPCLDVLLRLLKKTYVEGEPNAVTLGTVPFNKKLAVMVSHDVDFNESLHNSLGYAELEQQLGIPATYFIQTKYIIDYNDRIFFDQQGVEDLKKLAKFNAEIASHSVSHSKVYRWFPMGTGKEQYPDYYPFVEGEYKARNGTVLGELRVSKFLLDSFVLDHKVVSFRPGELSNPFKLSQALEATGYQYSSSVTSNDSLTHLPFQLNISRNQKEESKIFEFPVTIEDEEEPKMGDRIQPAVDLAHKLSRYGGIFVILIHPNILDHKLKFEREFVKAVKPFSWFGSVREYGNWYAARNEITVDVQHQGAIKLLTVEVPKPILGLTLQIPDTWKMVSTPPNVHQQGNAVIFDNVMGITQLKFK